MKILYVGDIHLRPDSIKQCLRLFDFINLKIDELNPDYVVFLGDQFDNHGILYLNLMDIFFSFIKSIKIPSIVLVGNHDRSNDYSQKYHGMEFLSNLEKCTVVHSHIVKENVLFCSYKYDPMKLVEIANSIKSDTLVCHQTFDGAMYDNGFYAKDGIDQNLFPQKQIISGHIHRQSVVGKVLYTGSSRWINMNDVNASKFLFFVNHENNTIKEIPILNVPRIISVDIKDEESLNSALKEDFGKDNVCFNVYGNQAFVSKVNDELLNMASKPKIRLFPTQVKQVRVKESSGIKEAFNLYINDFKPKFGSNITDLHKLAEIRINWNVK
jgi:DNA repair exonuclease SbcCD nuclease subunit